MKISPNIYLILLFLGIISVNSVFSQDDRLPDLDSGSKEVRTEGTVDLLPEGDFKQAKSTLVVRDSTQIKQILKKPESKPKSPDENTSVLGFNFLYYLIERYKLSDIVD
jgi:hypothetical protein